MNLPGYDATDSSNWLSSTNQGPFRVLIKLIFDRNMSLRLG